MKLENTLGFPDIIWKVRVPEQSRYFFTWLEVYRKMDANGLVQKKDFGQLFLIF